MTELMKKLTYLIDGEMILKYQVISEDLDALVSVKSDEDLRHMFDEIDRYESARAPKLRAFLFPSSPIVLENQTGTLDPHALEQRYIDAVNGVVRSSTFSIKQHPTLNTVQYGSLVSSACSSPRSPDSCTTETINNEAMLQSNYQNSRLNMHRVQSLPSICSLNAPQQNSHHVHQLPQYYRQTHQSGYQSPKPPVDLHKSVAPERLTSVRSVGRAEGVRYQVDPATHYYYPASRHYEDCSHCLDRRMIERTGGLAISPVPSSPLHGHSGMRAWDRTMGGDIMI
ncbi:hypothetical protein ACJIZ3_015801 [Penstemon smallii]|uniref:PB1 domain-containing protein n=1 Tax=Penstemon smallii TaxID=265156 RepID=A0ABD3RNP1_9LAMI